MLFYKRKFYCMVAAFAGSESGHQHGSPAGTATRIRKLQDDSSLMRRVFQLLLTKPVLWLVARFSSNPDEQRVHASLSKLYQSILAGDERKGRMLPLDTASRYILLSDQHKGGKDGSDDFSNAEGNYIQALSYYNQQQYHLVVLGDSEELWENLIWTVMRHNKASIAAEQQFAAAGRFTKLFGNHDLFWHNDPFAAWYLKSMYHQSILVYEGVVLQTQLAGDATNLLLTHGHQGDGHSDGNPFSAWLVSRVWAPLQAYLRINPNTPAYRSSMKTAHNRMMYQWSEQAQNPVLITGHTHQPVFASLTHLERLYKQLIKAESANDEEQIQLLNKEIRFRQKEYDYVAGNYMQLRPSYFNTGCCCYRDGDITGIEIADGMIRLVKWKQTGTGTGRQVLEEMSLAAVFAAANTTTPTSID